ncbi:glutathione synthetase-like [Nasonia vitripennis]|uniref:Glutathione synthetase n=1 Tax=Nasonia vitripennis TaxID=7425 RepID=A0A7M7QZQ7_NASVI|nr:glutathione synthetase-like [Nasonia vitripennis]
MDVRCHDDDDVVKAAKDWALVNGLVARTSNKLEECPTDRVEFVPFTLYPTEFPRSAYESVVSIQPLVNQLMLKVSRDGDFLKETLSEAGKVDDFTGRLLELHDIVQREGCVQNVELGLFRADYMLDVNRCDAGGHEAKSCKQVEVNTIASGQGWIGTACSRLHRYVLEEANLLERIADLPVNNPLEGLCRGMLDAWKMYNNPSAAILFVVEDKPRHIGDQRQHEYELRRQLGHRISVLRRSLGQLSLCASLSDERHLLVDGKEVALVYLRSGYSPSQYPSEAEWNARLTLERSRAIKCPNVGMHLAGCKKVQVKLAMNGVLEKFLEDEMDCRRMKNFFTGLYFLDSDSESIISKALSHPDDFVLKPQREGGANNFFGEDLRSKLESIRHSDERNAWILMDKIRPVVTSNQLIRPDVADNRPVDVTSELGIFGVVLSNGEKILRNLAVGHTLRTKLAKSNEGGVSSGFGACDSPLLVGDSKAVL